MVTLPLAKSADFNLALIKSRVNCRIEMDTK